jgi:hypothetical protein
MPTFDQPTAAYLYLLSIDAPGLAWEYLRRNDGYIADCSRDGAAGSAAAWGLRFR